VTLISLPGVKIGGVVHKLGDEASVSGASVTLPVTILLEEVDYDIKLGVSAQLDIIVEEVKDKVVVPVTAVFTKGGRDYVVKVSEGRNEEIAVVTGLSDGLNIVIESGLEPGDEILVNAFNYAPDYGSPGGMGGPGFFMGGRR
jgi:multidrug efflux pump subunit AcrA (membrane-fusion protein)